MNIHRNRVCGEPHVLADIEVVDGLDKPDAAYLEQVVQILAPPGEPLDNAEHKPQISVYKFISGFHVPGFNTLKKRLLFIVRKQR